MWGVIPALLDQIFFSRLFFYEILIFWWKKSAKNVNKVSVTNRRHWLLHLSTTPRVHSHRIQFLFSCRLVPANKTKQNKTKVSMLKRIDLDAACHSSSWLDCWPVIALWANAFCFLARRARLSLDFWLSLPPSPWSTAMMFIWTNWYKNGNI